MLREYCPSADLVQINLLGGITLLPISVPKAVQVSSHLRGCEECACAAASSVIAAYRLMTILRRPVSLADRQR